jgi:hypothetical protein
MNKPLYQRTEPLALFKVEARGDLFVIVGPGLEWSSNAGQERERVETMCSIINHAALMGWVECHTTMMTKEGRQN